MKSFWGIVQRKNLPNVASAEEAATSGTDPTGSIKAARTASSTITMLIGGAARCRKIDIDRCIINFTKQTSIHFWLRFVQAHFFGSVCLPLFFSVAASALSRCLIGRCFTMAQRLIDASLHYYPAVPILRPNELLINRRCSGKSFGFVAVKLFAFVGKKND